MSTIKNSEHPEVAEFIHICAMSPEAEGNKEICELIKKTTVVSKAVVTQFSHTKKEIKEDEELDESLKDTFPASDPITHY